MQDLGVEIIERGIRLRRTPGGKDMYLSFTTEDIDLSMLLKEQFFESERSRNHALFAQAQIDFRTRGFSITEGIDSTLLILLKAMSRSTLKELEGFIHTVKVLQNLGKDQFSTKKLRVTLQSIEELVKVELIARS